MTESWGTFDETWNGVSLDKDTKYYFSVAFGEGNATCRVTYNSKGKNKEDDLVLDFDFDKTTLEDVKRTVWLKNGRGTYHKVERGKESTQSFENQEFLFFILGPRLVFGIDMPHILLHELRLQKRTLSNLKN